MDRLYEIFNSPRMTATKSESECIILSRLVYLPIADAPAN